MINMSRPPMYVVVISLILSLMTSPLKAQSYDVVDVMVLYSSSAAQDKNGYINTYINSLIDSSNTNYQSSGMNIRIRLVHTEQYDVPGVNKIDASGLSYFRSDSRVNQLRAKHGADLVAYLKYGPSGSFCGIGYRATGSNGRLSSYAKNTAFSLTNSTCSTSFTHELGHNMGLSHSRRQGETGGVYDYGLGYGVDNVLGTTMAYAYLFNTRRIERFSNPRQWCNGVACGVDRRSSNGADAVYAVNAVSAQIADYLPSQYTGGSDSDPVRNVPSIPNNLISNASIEGGLSPWFQRYSATLSQSKDRRFTGEKSLKISNRQYNYSGVSQDLLGKMVDGGKYKINANLRLAGNGSDVATMVIGVEDSRGFRFEYFDRIGIKPDEWSAINEEFTLETTGTIKQLFIHFYGPKAENSFYLDQVSITRLGGNGGGNQPGSNIVLNGGLEAGTLANWESAYSGTINLTAQARGAGGRYAMYTDGRRNWYDGPSQYVTTRIESGSSYEFSAWVGLSDASTQPLSARLFYKDSRGSKWLTIAEADVTNSWIELKGSINNLQANGPITEARLHIFGPDSSSDFYVDDVQLIKK